MDPVAVVGAPAPDFVLHDPEGNAFRLADQRGKVVVLNFWSADCPHCERTDKMLASLRSVWGIEFRYAGSPPTLTRTTDSSRGPRFSTGPVSRCEIREHRSLIGMVRGRRRTCLSSTSRGSCATRAPRTM